MPPDSWRRGPRGPLQMIMNLRNGEPMNLQGYPPGIRRFADKKQRPVQCPLGRTFEALTEHFERCSALHGGCENCPGRTDGCMTAFDRVCKLGAERKLSRREAEPEILDTLKRVGGYTPLGLEPNKQPITAVMATQGIKQENASVERKTPGSPG